MAVHYLQRLAERLTAKPGQGESGGQRPVDAPDPATVAALSDHLDAGDVAPAIEAARPGHGKRFKAAADGRRGVTARVEREGAVGLGDAVTLFVPDQRGWQG